MTPNMLHKCDNIKYGYSTNDMFKASVMNFIEHLLVFDNDIKILVG